MGISHEIRKAPIGKKASISIDCGKSNRTCEVGISREAAEIARKNGWVPGRTSPNKGIKV